MGQNTPPTKGEVKKFVHQCSHLSLVGFGYEDSGRNLVSG